MDVMYIANKAKFEQNEDLKQVLVTTKGPITAGGFAFWAKWNPILLERLREELREPSRRDEENLRRCVAEMEKYVQSAARGSA